MTGCSVEHRVDGYLSASDDDTDIVAEWLVGDNLPAGQLGLDGRFDGGSVERWVQPRALPPQSLEREAAQPASAARGDNAEAAAPFLLQPFVAAQRQGQELMCT